MIESLNTVADPRPLYPDAADRLVLGTIPMHCKFNADYCASPEPSTDYADRVSTALLRAIATTTRAKIYVLHMFGPKDDRSASPSRT